MIRNHSSMRRRGVSLAAAVLFSLPASEVLVFAQDPAVSGDEQFNGRWDITTTGGRSRAWWLEIENAGTPTPKGKFISAFSGDLNVIEEISISGRTLRFGWTRQERPSPGAEPVTRKLVYTAKLVNGRLQGTFEVEGWNQRLLEWTGVRAPVINEIDDGTWGEGKHPAASTDVDRDFDENSLRRLELLHSAGSERAEDPCSDGRRGVRQPKVDAFLIEPAERGCDHVSDAKDSHREAAETPVLRRGRPRPGVDRHQS